MKTKRDTFEQMFRAQKCRADIYEAALVKISEISSRSLTHKELIQQALKDAVTCNVTDDYVPWRQRAFISIEETAAIMARSTDWVRGRIGAESIEGMRLRAYGPVLVSVPSLLSYIEKLKPMKLKGKKLSIWLREGRKSDARKRAAMLSEMTTDNNGEIG